LFINGFGGGVNPPSGARGFAGWVSGNSIRTGSLAQAITVSMIKKIEHRLDIIKFNNLIVSVLEILRWQHR
jgi:hypothetical protein